MFTELMRSMYRDQTNYFVFRNQLVVRFRIIIIPIKIFAQLNGVFLYLYSFLYTPSRLTSPGLRVM